MTLSDEKEERGKEPSETVPERPLQRMKLFVQVIGVGRGETQRRGG